MLRCSCNCFAVAQYFGYCVHSNFPSNSNHSDPLYYILATFPAKSDHCDTCQWEVVGCGCILQAHHFVPADSMNPESFSVCSFVVMKHCMPRRPGQETSLILISFTDGAIRETETSAIVTENHLQHCWKQQSGVVKYKNLTNEVVWSTLGHWAAVTLESVFLVQCSLWC